MKKGCFLVLHTLLIFKCIIESFKNFSVTKIIYIFLRKEFANYTRYYAEKNKERKMKNKPIAKALFVLLSES